MQGGTRMPDGNPKHHFLVVAAAARGARFFIKKALRQGHDVTALCRAADDQAAHERMTRLLQSSGQLSGTTLQTALQFLKVVSQLL